MDYYYSNRRAIPRQATKFRPNRATRGGIMTSYTISRLQQRWHSSTSGFLCNDVTLIYPQTKFRRRILIKGWDITISGLENKRPPYWNSSSLCYFDQIAVICVLYWIKFPNFAQIGPSAAEWWRRMQFQDGSHGGAVLYFRFRIWYRYTRSSQCFSTYFNLQLRYNYFQFWKRT